MPPRRRTFYLADATLLVNPKVRRLARGGPDWLACVGVFHVLMGVATLNESPEFTDDELEDILGSDAMPWVEMLRKVGMMTPTGINRETFEAWLPKARPRYPSDGLPRSHTDSGVVGSDSGGIPAEFPGMPTSSTSSVSTTTTSSPSKQRQPIVRTSAESARFDKLTRLSEQFQSGSISESEYQTQRKAVQ